MLFRFNSGYVTMFVGIQCLSVLRLRVGAKSTWAVGLEIGKFLGIASSWPQRSQLNSKAVDVYSIWHTSRVAYYRVSSKGIIFNVFALLLYSEVLSSLLYLLQSLICMKTKFSILVHDQIDSLLRVSIVVPCENFCSVCDCFQLDVLLGSVKLKCHRNVQFRAIFLGNCECISI